MFKMSVEVEVSWAEVFRIVAIAAGIIINVAIVADIIYGAVFRNKSWMSCRIVMLDILYKSGFNVWVLSQLDC